VALQVSMVAIDCRDAERLAGFWCEVLGYKVESVEEDGVSIVSGDGSGWGIDFLVVPDDKVVKNRLHLDLRPDDQQAEVDRLLDLGATRVDVGQGDDASWVVLADPEGNEFCILREEAAV
jgi:catechol 2,3-dioxygenase-like lactoylglutathione lyase family enzyme